MKKSGILSLILTSGIILTACSAQEQPAAAVPGSKAVQSEAAAVTTASSSEIISETESDTEAVITVPDQLVIPDDMVPIYGSDLRDGVYSIRADSSSSMFNITECRLTVDDGQMTAVMTMGGTGYLYVFMGRGDEADTAEGIPFEEDENGVHSFTIPVEALDKGIDCAAFSKKKEIWYDRTLLFRADSLPADAFRDGFITSVDSLGLSDGEYTVEVKLEGGSGRASVQSPAKLTVENGTAYAELVWSSNKYDYMVVNDERYDTVNTDGNSTFVIPVTGFDYKMPVSADTTAMSTPYEIEYTLFFDSSTIN